MLAYCLPADIHCLKVVMRLNNCFQVFSTKVLREKAFTLGELQKKSKTALQLEYFRGAADRSNHDCSVRKRLCRCSGFILPCPVAVGMLIFTLIVGCWFSRLQSWGMWVMGTGQIKLTLLSKSQLFFLNKNFLNSCNL